MIETRFVHDITSFHIQLANFLKLDEDYLNVILARK